MRWYYILKYRDDLLISTSCFSDFCFAQNAGKCFRKALGLDKHTLIIVTEEYIEYFKKSLIKGN